MEFQRRQLAASEDSTVAASELGRTAEQIRIEEQLIAAEHNLHDQAQIYSENLRKEAEYKKKREEELAQASASANDAAIEHATENKSSEVLLARQAEISAQQKEQASFLAAETFYSGENQNRDVKFVMEEVHKESENQSLKASKGQKNVMFEYNKPARMCAPVQKQALDLIYSANMKSNTDALLAPHSFLQKWLWSGMCGGSGRCTRCPSKRPTPRKLLSS